MRLLHTSDWHLGRSLYGKQRYREFEAFLNWLYETIVSKKIDLLLVAGDIFDTATPGTKAQELYYSFLCRVAGSCCRDIIITSGNHDSPTFLSAPKEILRHLNIRVIASTDDVEDEVIEIKDADGHVNAVVCGVPYLRDRDIRTVTAGESSEEKALNLVNGVTEHYKKVGDIAQKLAVDGVPIIAMGHLFVTGGKTLADDGVRELYVGSLAHIGAEIFPCFIDYVALGHLHVPQRVGGSDFIRYSGSPIPMGFGEAQQQKVVIVVDLSSSADKKIEEVPVPTFQKLVPIRGDREDILSTIAGLKEDDSNAWLEIEYQGSALVPELQMEIEEAIAGSKLEVRVVKNRFITNKTLASLDSVEELEQLNLEDVFERCLDIYEIEDGDRTLLKRLHSEIIDGLEEDADED